MEWSTTYIISQVLTIIKYGLLGVTYYVKDRKKVLFLIFTSAIVTLAIFVLLNAWSGLATTGISLLANTIFLIDEIKNGKKEKNDIRDVRILLFIISLFIIFSVITYESFFSLFSIFAGITFIYSMWQKNTKVYKILGIVTSILWTVYNIYIMSLFGIILEGFILFSSITGYYLEIKKPKDNKIENV